MEEHAGRRFCEFSRFNADRGGPVRDLCGNWNRLLDRWLAIRQPAFCRSADDVRIAVPEPVLLQYDGQNLSRPDGNGPDIYHDPDFQHGDLPAAVGSAATGWKRRLQILVIKQLVPLVQF